MCWGLGEVILSPFLAHQEPSVCPIPACADDFVPRLGRTPPGTSACSLQPHSWALGVTPAVKFSSISWFAVALRTLNIDLFTKTFFLVLNNLFIINNAALIEINI